MKALLRKTDGSMNYVECDEKYLLDYSKKFLGKDTSIEYVFMNDDLTFVMTVDEDGHLKELPFNFFISTTSPFYPVQIIVGDVLFFRIKKHKYGEEDYEVEDITNEETELLDEILSPEMQKKLYIAYKNQGR